MNALTVPPCSLGKPTTATERLFHSARLFYLKMKWGAFGKEDKEFIRRLINSGIDIENMWDIGASNGAWSLMVGNHFPQTRLHLFEPLVEYDPDYCNMLRCNLAFFDTWALHNVALGAFDGVKEIFIADMSHGSTLLASDYAKENWRSVNISGRTMASMIESDGLEVPDIIKMDTQGSELDIINGGLDYIARSKALIIETWLSRDYGAGTPLLDEISATLRSVGFHLVEIIPGYRLPDGTMRSVDAYYVSGDIAARLGYYS